MKTASLAALVLVCLLEIATGSEVVFESSHDYILAPNLSMRCSLKDTGSSSQSSGADHGDVTPTTSHVLVVTSVTVERDGVDLAQVTLCNPATVRLDKTNLQATGDIAGNSSERGFLELTWAQPTKDQAGVYTCHVSGVTFGGQKVDVYRKKIIYDLTATVVGPLVSRVQELEQEKESTLRTMGEIQTQLSSTQVMLQDLSQLKHIEAGTVECGRSKTYNVRDGIFDSGVVTVNFAKPYSRPPVVSLSLVRIDTEHTITTRLYVKVAEVTTTSVTVKCMTWYGSIVYGMLVQWVSFPTVD